METMLETHPRPTPDKPIPLFSFHCAVRICETGDSMSVGSLGHVGAGHMRLEPLPGLYHRGSESGKFVPGFPGRVCEDVGMMQGLRKDHILRNVETWHN